MCLQSRLWTRPDTRMELTSQSDKVEPDSGLTPVLGTGRPVFSALRLRASCVPGD